MINGVNLLLTMNGLSIVYYCYRCVDGISLYYYSEVLQNEGKVFKIVIVFDLIIIMKRNMNSFILLFILRMNLLYIG